MLVYVREKRKQPFYPLLISFTMIENKWNFDPLHYLNCIDIMNMMLLFFVMLSVLKLCVLIGYAEYLQCN